jgi:AAA15 family ATPase/GTPase
MHPTDRAAGAEEQQRFGELVLGGNRGLIVEALQLFDERITDVQFLPTKMGSYFVVERDDEIAPLGLLGGGINGLFRFILTVTFARGGFVGIDEVENGFHHSLHREVFVRLFEVANRNNTQLFLTTHSAEALRALVDAATETDEDDFAVVHLRREKDDAIFAKVFREKDALASLDLGYELR